MTTVLKNIFTKSLTLLTLTLLVLTPYQSVFAQEVSEPAPAEAVEASEETVSSEKELSTNGSLAEGIAGIQARSSAASSFSVDAFNERLTDTSTVRLGALDDQSGAFTYSYPIDVPT